MRDWRFHKDGFVTGWFSGDAKPAYPGVYERQYDLPGKSLFSIGKNAKFAFARFNGKRWSRACASIDEAAAAPCRAKDNEPPRPWRGLHFPLIA